MRKALVFVAVLLLMGAFPSVSAGGARTAVRIVSLDAGSFPRMVVRVQVVDEVGRPVVGLDREDFSVFEDGTSVDARLSQVFIGSEGVGAVLAVDVSGSMEGRPIAAAKEAAIQFLGTLSSFDRAGVVAFGDGVRKVIPVGGRNLRPLRRLEASDATTHLYEGVLQAARLAQGIEASRKAVVLLTDGRDEGSSLRLGQLLRRLPRRVAVHAIGLRSGSFQAGPLREMARRTGGSYQEAGDPEELLGLYRDLAQDLRAEYLLTYKAPGQPDRARELTVTVGEGTGSASATEVYRPPTVSQPAEPVADEGIPLEIWLGAAIGGLLLVIVLLLLLNVRSRRRLRQKGEADSQGVAPVDDGPGPALVAGLDRFPLRADEVFVGRGSGAGLQLEDGTVSRVHARIWRQNGELYVEDLNSANGTFVNGERVDATTLQEGDTVKFGDAEFTYEVRL